jgi:hypothetical protein
MLLYNHHLYEREILVRTYTGKLSKGKQFELIFKLKFINIEEYFLPISYPRKIGGCHSRICSAEQNLALNTFLSIFNCLILCIVKFGITLRKPSLGNMCMYIMALLVIGTKSTVTIILPPKLIEANFELPALILLPSISSTF